MIGDGLSAAAVATQVPALLPALLTSAAEAGWSIGQPFAVRQCRVGVMNDIGDLLHPTVIVLLIGERPGLATAESLSTYLAHRPRSGHTDADRNLLSNIHHRGITPAQAVERITGLAQAMHTLGISGVSIKEPTTVRALPTTAPPRAWSNLQHLRASALRLTPCRQNRTNRSFEHEAVITGTPEDRVM